MKEGFSDKIKQKHFIEVFAMSNLRTQSTGVDGAVIWVSSGEFQGKESQHGPRVKVMLGSKVTPGGLDKAATITLTDPPRVLGDLPSESKKQALSFVTTNLQTLLKYWKNEIDTAEMVEAIQKVS